MLAKDVATATLFILVHSSPSQSSEMNGQILVKGLCVVDGKVLLVKEPLDMSGQWELPGGGLDFGEDSHKGLKREIEEELRLEVTSVSAEPIYVWTSRFEDRREMDWYYSLVLGYAITLAHFDFTPTAECESISFFEKDELQTLDLFHQSMRIREVFDPLDFVSNCTFGGNPDSATIKMYPKVEEI